MTRLPRKWLIAGVLSMAAALWLTWAFPRLHPASRLGLHFDRRGYLDQARKTAAANGVDLSGWRGYALLDTQRKYQDLHRLLPNDETARAFPDADVETNFLPASKGKNAKLTLRVDGRPLSWKLPIPDKAIAGASDTSLAQGALRQIAGSDADRYVPEGEPTHDEDGVTYKWKRSSPGAVTPSITVEASVKNGMVWRASTVFRSPTLPKTLDALPIFRVAISTAWFVLLFIAIIVPVVREGGGGAARALKDVSAVRLSAAAGLLFMTAALLEWDDDMIAVPVATATTMEALSLLLGAVIIGLLFYSMCAATALNGRMHTARVRGFRLMGTRAFFSKATGGELLAGWLFAPVIVALPLAIGAILRAPAFKGYDDSFVLGRLPVLDALANSFTQETIAVVAALGVLIPLAKRWFGARPLGWIAMALFMTLTFAMLNSPFRGAQAANVTAAAVEGIVMLWLYDRFGMLGALSGHCFARVLTSGAVLMVQPSAGLHGSGIGILLAFGLVGALCAIAATKGPEVVAELYGESNARIQARSRREELLAEFNVARIAQERMLPAKAPEIAGYTIAASCEPAREVGGDLYDFLRLRDGRWGIGVADVSGKGVPAALYMTLTKGLLCAASQESDDPKMILGVVNKHLRTVTKKKMFVTMAMGVLDPEGMRMEYVRAGHNPVVWRRRDAGETRLLAGAGIGLGIAGPALFGKTLTAETLDLASGDALVFYSDGLTEAMNSELEQFGEERLVAAVESADGMHATDTRDSILREVKQFLNGGHSQDDLTIAVLRVN